ncbi:hypothetical protein [Candidatus Uabimicrobium amorphum]|uniref:Uncharacterized protein n=1 Tax=Uabimicrobium amorphum TaxID=2596890 RepID=A0A5S9IHA4_UABAM|nr:hypothetical protein [Candidatus Uabimicrobium amorphum]BBM81799.1 hypothetical protein UABAM_00138 [Candidatus Uabimicrobium amorphum]
MDSSEGYDSYKIYIGMMGVLCILATGWLIYNYLSYSSYVSSFDTGIRDYKKIVALEPQMPPPAESDDEEDPNAPVVPDVPVIQKTFTFFKRTVPGITPERVEGPELEKENEDDIAFIDRSYNIGFRSISREKLSRYIFYIKERALALKVNLVVKSLEMDKVESARPYEDQWKVELVFVHRVPDDDEDE